MGSPKRVCAVTSAAVLSAVFGAELHASGLVVVGRDATPSAEPFDSNIRTFLVNPPAVQQVGAVLPFGPGFRGGVRVAVGDFNGNGTHEIIAGMGPDPNAVSGTQTFDSTPGSTNYAHFPYPNFHGGLYVASGHVNNNAFDDQIIGPGTGIPPTVKVYDGGTGQFIHSFNAYDAGFTGGVRVAAGDVTGDGLADIVTGAGPGSAGGHVRVFNGQSLAVERSFFAFPPNFTGGVFVASGDVNGDGHADIITSADEGGLPQVRVFDGITLDVVWSFSAFDASFSGGVRVAATDVNGDGYSDIIAGAGPGALPQVRIFSGSDLSTLASFLAFEPNFTGGVFVAAAIPEASAGIVLVSLVAASSRVRRRDKR